MLPLRYKFLYLSIILSSIISSSWSVRGSEETFTNDWLVKIEGGPSVADLIARKHGFINRGQINDMDQWYHFVHAVSPRRSRRGLTDKHQALSSENMVLHVEQQIVKRRVKRGEDFSLPSDPLWSAEWYLNDQYNHGRSTKDMNVQWAWEQGITGKGVVVTILDDGLERNNPDIKDNYDAEASFDFNSHDDDPNPRYDYTNENKHGTRCAGEVASAKNDVCAVGVAYESSIGGVRMLDGDVTDVVEGNSLSFRSQHIDIYSSSWGPDDDGRTVDGPGTLAKTALETGVTRGRRGLGSIFMWASGNGGSYQDSCSCDGYVISIHTIAIGSVGQNGDRPWYSEACPATLAVTYSSGSTSEQQIVTADIRNKCTRRHTGTSAAAPLAAGIVALALQANPKLTWRDVQHLIVLTSRSEPMKSVSASDWNKNGAGHPVSHLFGFGLMDATALVNRARHWETVPDAIKCTIDFDTRRSINSYRVQVDQSHCEIQYLEHVQVVISMGVSSRRGEIFIDLQSPYGYTSHLLPRRGRDFHTEGFNKWPFMSVHHWGESPIGTWTLTHNSGRVNSAALVLHGTSQKPAAISRIPRSCDPNCVGGCSAEGSEYCDQCASLQMKTSLACVDECPEGTRQNLHMCLDCPENCANCSDDDNTCLECRRGFIASSEGTCIHSCPPQTFHNNKTGSCDLCNSTCEECSGPSDSDCTSCSSIHYSLHNGMCILNTTCPRGSYFDKLDMSCEMCDVTCAECNGKGAGDCTACFPEHILNHTICVPERSCPPGQYIDDDSCSACIEHCQQCDNPLTCQQCNDKFFLMTEKLRGGETSRCLQTCPDKWFASISDKLCVECHETCLTCDGPGSQHCLTCYPNGSHANDNNECEIPCDTGLYYNPNSASCELCTEKCANCLSEVDCVLCKPGFFLLPNTAVCSEKCTPGYYGDKVTTKCLKCDNSCKTCDGGESNNCLSCSEHMVLSDGVCLSDCPDKTFRDRINWVCGKCHTSCSTCLGPRPTECLTCNSPLVLDNHKCVKDCPHASVNNDGQCEACPANCDECASSKRCTKCTSGYYLYDPEPEKCVQHCPGGHYGEAGVCKTCKSPCNECSSVDKCLSCVRNYRMLDGTCKPCCKNGQVGPDCCDCTSDGSQCSETSSQAPNRIEDQRPSSSNRSTIMSILIIATVIALVLLIASVLFYIYRRQGKEPSYMLMPRSGDGLPSLGSDTEDELFTKS